jgi:hypothetical protein
MFEKPLVWLRKHWWGIIVAYLLLLISSYFTIWQFAEPLAIPDTLEELPTFTKTRIFFHLNLTLLVTAHLTLILILLIRYKEQVSPQSTQNEKLLLEKIGLGVSDTSIEKCWRFSEGTDPKPTLKLFDDGFFGKALEIKSMIRYAADYDVQAQASLGATIEFVIKQDDQKAIVYAHLIVLSRDSSESKSVWLSFPIGLEKPSPVGEGDGEWRFPIKPDHLDGNWLRFQIDLSEAVGQTFGTKGWRYGQLKGFRLRGNLSIAYICVFARK